MLRSLQAVRDHVSRRRQMAGLAHEIAAAVGPAARDPANLTLRECPVCGGAPGPEPAVAGPVYAFHDCASCGMRFAPRVLGRKATHRYYTQGAARRAFWREGRGSARADAARDVYGPLARRLAELTPHHGLVVDVGCGFGALLAALGRHFDAAIGLELDKATAEAARDDFGVDARTTRIERLDVPPGSVDLVVMNQVLEHLVDCRRPLLAARELLRPGGVLWIGIPHGRSLGMRVLGGRHPVVGTHVHVNLFDAGSLRKLAEGCGFEARSVVVTDGFDLGATQLTQAMGVGWTTGPALAVDQVLRRLASATRWPSRAGLGSHLEAVLTR